MKTILALLLVVAATLSSCTDKEIADLRATIDRLKVMAGANQMALKLMQTGWIEKITPMAEGNGYVVQVNREEQMTFYAYNSENEDIRISSETVSNGNKYWTMSKQVVPSASMHTIAESRSVDQPDWVTDDKGNRVSDTGDNLMIRINESTLTWDISTDGITWVNTTFSVEEEPSFELDSQNNSSLILSKKDGSTTQVMCER